MLEITKLNPKTSALLTLDCQKGIVEEVHRVLTEKVFAKQASVVRADTFIERML